jgi:hypothetical protein
MKRPITENPVSSDVRYRAECYPSTEAVVYETFRVTKETRCGVMVYDYNVKPKFILERHIGAPAPIKRFAWPTKAEALESLYRRKMKRKGLLQCQLFTVRQQLRAIAREQAHPSYVPKLLEAPK